MSMRAVSYVNSLARALQPLGSRLHLMAAMIAYLDESLDGTGRKVIAMAGWICTSSQWENFEKQWKTVLDKYCVPEFKASACENRKDEFEACDCTSIKSELMSVIDEIQPIGVTTAINLTDAKHLLPKKDWRAKAYDLCVQYCLVELARKAPDCLPQEEVTFLLDERAEVTRSIQRLRKRLIDPAHFDSWDKIGTIAPHSSKKVLPLQAADWLAYETYRDMYERLNLYRIRASWTDRV